jgi:hypothetical protein
MYSADTFCRDIGINLSMDYEAPVDSIFMIRPNPVHDFMTITFREKTVSDVLFELYSSHGQLVMSQDLTEGKFDHFIDLSNLAPGVYIYRVDTRTDKPFTGKLLVY